MTRNDLIKIHDNLYEIPQSGKMNVSARIYASEHMLTDILHDNAAEQAMNVAHLPGIVGHSFAMPDMHWGYGFPIGGVAAFDINDGVVSPGGVGYDINCGVRLLKTNLTKNQIKPQLSKIIDTLYKKIPTGVGSTGPVKLSQKDEKKMLVNGAEWAVENGYGSPADLDKIEENGKMQGANPDAVSERALTRGKAQLGTLGSGNHFVEVGFVQEIFDQNAANVLGLYKNQITIIIHTGSRGFGHQVCDDSIKVMLKAAEKYGIHLPDRQLCCAPIQSPEGQRYLQAMACAINFAFCNRQMIKHWVADGLRDALKMSASQINLQTVYEIAHNIAKIEQHEFDGQKRTVCVHRKGATRAFGPHHPEIPQDYREIGQPVLIPGDMGRYSYVLTGTEKSMHETFGSTCHGAGRLMSRKKAIQQAKGRTLHKELASQGIYIKANSYATIAEEMPEAYKNVSDVVEVVSQAGIANKVAKLKPLGVIKG